TRLVIANNKVEGVETTEGFLAFDNVIITTPSLSKALSPYRACGKAPPGLAGARAEPVMGQSPTIDRIRYQCTICALFGLERSLMNGVYWLNIKADVPFGAIIEHTNLIPRADYGENLFYVVSYVQEEDELWKKSDKEIVDLYLEGIEKLFPDFHREEVKWWELARGRFTAPVYELGYKNKILPYSSNVKGLYLAGMFSSPNYPERSMDGSLKAGFECAEEVMKRGERAK
ncbi:MAG: FAD-dependent oxidoreductase, partial [Candidatus Syntrophoarchaeum sp.]|nr:FAD-dependent oxidoreductase [Candidatus Syntrophoarchaeum sp.]